MISKDTIEEIKSRIDIVDVVSDFVTLKKSGQTFSALSPFTDEKTPSFYVIPKKGIFKCHSSGIGGDAITFVMRHEHMDYPSALKYLAKKYSVEIKEEKGTSPPPPDLDFQIMAWAAKTYKEEFWDQEKNPAKSLLDFRGLKDAEILRKFDIGYAPNDWNWFWKQAIAQGFPKEKLLALGLVKLRPKNQTLYDSFRNRIICPIHDENGNPVGITARLIGKPQVKYGKDGQIEFTEKKHLNSNDSGLYKKSHHLYGLHLAKEEARKLGYLIAVEGGFDTIMMQQEGFKNVVASLGTAFGEHYCKLIKKYDIPLVYVVFDGDKAGFKAANLTIDLLLRESIEVKVVLIPDDHDPQSYLAKYKKEGFVKLMENAMSLIEFKTYDYHELKTPNKKTKRIEEIIRTLDNIPSPVLMETSIAQVSAAVDIPVEVLKDELAFYQRTNVRKDGNRYRIVVPRKPLPKEFELIRILAQKPSWKSGENSNITDLVIEHGRGILPEKLLDQLETEFRVKGEFPDMKFYESFYPSTRGELNKPIGWFDLKPVIPNSEIDRLLNKVRLSVVEVQLKSMREKEKSAGPEHPLSKDDQDGLRKLKNLVLEFQKFK
jgi:DNA primase